MKNIFLLMFVVVAMTTHAQTESSLDRELCNGVNNEFMESGLGNLYQAIPQYKDTYDFVIRVRLDYSYTIHNAFIEGFMEDDGAVQIFKAIGYKRIKLIYNDVTKIKYL